MTIIPQSHLPRKVAEATGQSAPNPRTLYNMTVGARWPAHQVNGRWYIEDPTSPWSSRRWA